MKHFKIYFYLRLCVSVCLSMCIQLPVGLGEGVVGSPGAGVIVGWKLTDVSLGN